jgi:hypothetical protein
MVKVILPFSITAPVLFSCPKALARRRIKHEEDEGNEECFVRCSFFNAES